MVIAIPMLGTVKHAFAIQREFVDWSLYRQKLAAGTTLLSVTPIAPAGLTATSGGVAGDISAVILSGGTGGRSYDVALRAEWSNGDTDDRTLRVEARATVVLNAEPIRLDPNADIVFGVDWSALLTKIGGGVTISGHAWPAASGITIGSPSLVGNVSQARHSAIALGGTAVSEAQVTLANGDRDARNLSFWGRQT